jgi:hypothetical protein
MLLGTKQVSASLKASLEWGGPAPLCYSVNSEVRCDKAVPGHRTLRRPADIFVIHC